MGTVIQAYLYEADDLIDKYPELRLRLVKGAYKEDASIAINRKKKLTQIILKLLKTTTKFKELYICSYMTMKLSTKSNNL